MDNRIELDISASDPPPGQKTVENLEIALSVSETVTLPQVQPRWWGHVSFGKITLFCFSLYLFILAISFMKIGARGIIPLINNIFSVHNGANALGFGWLFAYVIMSGSPVAASALTFFDAGALNQLEAYSMISGSRLGASFIVLFLGFIYVLKGRNRATNLSIGLLSLTVTASTYLPGLLLGFVLLNKGWLNSLQLQSGTLLQSAMDVAIEPLVRLAVDLLPNWVIFLSGLSLILISFTLFDKCLPQMTLKESQVGWMSRLVYRPGIMFVLGALVTLISMSVSLSLSLLIPLSSRGFVRRENVIPYIMGANITTFIDTLLAAVLLNNPMAFTIVFVEMVSITIMSLLILIVFYQRYQRAMLDFVGWVTACDRNLIIFMITIFSLPITLMLF
jgi:sodium-dependent phosphate cotransporter